MEVQTHYTTNNGRRALVGLSIQKAPKFGRHHFDTRWIRRCQPFISVTEDDVVMHTRSHGDVAFPIEWPTGTWCLHCGEKLPDTVMNAANVEAALKHVATHNAPSPRGDKWKHGYITVSKTTICCLSPSDLVGTNDPADFLETRTAPAGVLMEQAS